MTHQPRVYVDPSWTKVRIMAAIRIPISDILGTRASRIAAGKSEPHVRAAATRRAKVKALRDEKLAALKGE